MNEMFSKDLDSEDTMVAGDGKCHLCAWFNKKTCTTCEAFPNGIPAEIFFGAWDHQYFYDKNGVSDDGLRFTTQEEIDKLAAELEAAKK